MMRTMCQGRLLRSCTSSRKAEQAPQRNEELGNERAYPLYSMYDYDMLRYRPMTLPRMDTSSTMIGSIKSFSGWRR